jgi:hypothetical protein
MQMDKLMGMIMSKLELEKEYILSKATKTVTHMQFVYYSRLLSERLSKRTKREIIWKIMYGNNGSELIFQLKKACISLKKKPFKKVF